MARSLSLAAYMAIARRTPSAESKYDQKRPIGELVWAHAATADKIAALLQLGLRLTTLRPGLWFLITLPEGVPEPFPPCDNIIWLPVPAESTTGVLEFLNHWQPDICLWSKGNLRPALITCAADQDIPLFLIDAEVEGFEDARWRWLPDMSRAVLDQFSGVMASTANAAKRLRRLGVKAQNITLTGPLQEGSAPLPFAATVRDDLAETLAGRPIWLAACVHMDEMEIITGAHKIASRLAHRILLIIAPDATTDSDTIYTNLTEDGWRVTRWSDGALPDENTQILLADTKDEMGLWYRLAPTSFMASSLTNDHHGRDPFAPAALGSAILYGPNIGHHLSAYSRLAAAGAARIVRDTETLGAAVSRLIAPDQAASMAHAAWDVASHGAEATDMVLDLVQDTLDMQGAG